VHYRLQNGVWWDYEPGVAHCTGLDCIGRLSLVAVQQGGLFILDCGLLMDIILDPKTLDLFRSICVKPCDGKRLAMRYTSAFTVFEFTPS